jgi:hypothetical protein
MKALARWISILGHPFVMVGLMVGVAASRSGPPRQTLRALGLVALVALVPVAALMWLQVRRGAWQNVDASNARERPPLFWVGGAALLALLIYLWLRQPESFLIRGSVAVLAMLGICAVATRWVKVSLHLAFAALAATSLLLLGSRVGWILVAVLPALAWSRLALGRHRPIELALGGAVGALTGVALYVL